MRGILAGAAGAAVAGLGAVILGEYPFSGPFVPLAGLLVGLFVAETVVGVGGRRGGAPAATAALLAAAGLVWAGWIAESHDLSEVAIEGWAAVGLGAGAAAVRAKRPRAGARSRSAPAPGP